MAALWGKNREVESVTFLLPGVVELPMNEILTFTPAANISDLWLDRGSVTNVSLRRDVFPSWLHFKSLFSSHNNNNTHVRSWRPPLSFITKLQGTI